MRPEPTRLYRWLLKVFPEKDYDAHQSQPWDWFFRFDIRDEGDSSLYLRRFVLLRAPFGSLYLHHIVRSDHDRCLHDHPWNSFIFVLWGGYHEHLGDAEGDFPEARRVVWRGPLSLRRMPAGTRHRVELNVDPGGEIPAWTLCAAGRKVRDWGFWTQTGWVQWKAFLSGGREC